MKKWFSAIFKLGTAACAIAGVLLLVSLGGDAQLLCYYTVQSNLICAAVMLLAFVLTLSGKTQGRWYGILKLGAAMCILLTFLVYNLLLAPTMFTMESDYDNGSAANLLVHVVTPLLVLADWLVFDEKGKVGWLAPLWWTIAPYAYLGFVYIYRALGGVFRAGGAVSKYPYFFLDADKYGVWGVIMWIAAISVAYMALSYLLVLADRGLVKLTARYRIKKESSQ